MLDAFGRSMIRQQELIDMVLRYDPRANTEAIGAAYSFAMKAHGDQMRASGDPFFSHPVEVAALLTEMKLDSASIITALLHDTVEDTDATLDEVEKLFGSEVATLVDGVTKLSQLELTSTEATQAENFRKLVLAMSNDIRVLIVKLADRLHNMRTICYVKREEKRKSKAVETMEIYAPLAGRIGMHHVKDELEDLSFAQTNPEARNSIIARLQFLREEGVARVGDIIHELEQLFESHNMRVSVSGREKTPYSIWNKMRKQNIPFEQLADIMAFRVMTESIEECYHALGVIHGAYPVVPGKFKDYISTPKPNGYQSIHTTVLGPYNMRIEVQIRTHSMHEVNEYGVAAHWKYKQGAHLKADKESLEYRWLRGLLDILENTLDSEEFLEHTKLEMFQDQVFCFTPKGDLVSLPSGATPIDFAYAVHSEVGNHCVGAKINGRMVPLRTILHNGDQVDITTSKAQSPSPTWERYAVTGKARSAIRRFIRSQKRIQFEELGRAMLHKVFKQEKLQYSEKKITEHLAELGCKELADLFAVVGEGIKSPLDVIRALYPEHERQKQHLQETAPESNILGISDSSKLAKSATSLSIQGLIPGMAVHYAGCCHPLPGDRIVGIVITGRGVTIHTYDCENLKKFANEPDRWLDVSWSESKAATDQYVARLHIIVFNRMGALAEMTTTIGKHKGNIQNFKLTHRTEAFFELNVDVEVQDITHLNNIIAALRSSPLINMVERSKS